MRCWTGCTPASARDELYRRTGIQTMPINTVFQLSSEAGGAAARVAERHRADPRPAGAVADRHARQRADDRLHHRAARGPRLALGVRPHRAAWGCPRASLRRRGGRARAASSGRCTTATPPAPAPPSAPRCAPSPGTTPRRRSPPRPLAGPHGAVLSSGTWSLLGVEAREPALSPEAAAFNLTNERGVGGTVRLLRNVMGLWLVQECRRDVGSRRGRPRLRPPRRSWPARRRPDVAAVRSRSRRRCCAAATCPSGSPACAPARGSRLRRIPASCCARSSSRWPASTGWCSSSSRA